MLYEFHKYHIRTGPSMEEMHETWKGNALPMMLKHGINPVGFWETLIGDAPNLNYLLPFADWADREKRWKEYQGDPEKKGGRASDGKGYHQYDEFELWVPTSYSALK